MASVTVLDEAPSGQTFSSRQISFSSETITLRDLIRQRIQDEVEEFNRKHTDVFLGLIEPTDAERVLNGYRLRKPRQIRWEHQYERALEGFRKNAFFVIINGRQVDELDKPIPLVEPCEVHFLKLVPLVGG